MILTNLKLSGNIQYMIPHHTFKAPCGLRGCKNGPVPFPGRMSYKASKPGLVCLSYLSMLYYCIVVYYGPFLCIVSFRSCVFWLLVVLVKLSLLAKWLLERPLWGSLTVARGSSPWSPGRRERMIVAIRSHVWATRCKPALLRTSVPQQGWSYSRKNDMCKHLAWRGEQGECNYSSPIWIPFLYTAE